MSLRSRRTVSAAAGPGAERHRPAGQGSRLLAPAGLRAVLSAAMILPTAAPALASGGSGTAAQYLIFFIGIPILCPVPIIIALVRRRYRLWVSLTTLATAATITLSVHYEALALVAFFFLWVTAMMLACSPRAKDLQAVKQGNSADPG